MGIERSSASARVGGTGFLFSSTLRRAFCCPRNEFSPPPQKTSGRSPMLRSNGPFQKAVPGLNLIPAISGERGEGGPRRSLERGEGQIDGAVRHARTNDEPSFLVASKKQTSSPYHDTKRPITPEAAPMNELSRACGLIKGKRKETTAN